jgi:capsular polysaccharide biosynthesis protein
MEIRDYWQILIKRWWILLLCVAVASGAAYGYSKRQQPIYRSSAKIYVTAARPDYGLTLVIKDVIRQYSQQILSDRFLNQVIDDLRLDLSPEALREKISAAGTADNLAIQIQVDDPDPVTAQRIAKDLAAVFVENHQIEMAPIEPRDRIDLKVYDDPQPGTLHSPKTRVNVMAGAIFGLLLGAIIAFLIEYSDDTIKSAEDVERYISLPAVGSIPRVNPSQAHNPGVAEPDPLTRLNPFRH